MFPVSNATGSAVHATYSYHSPRFIRNYCCISPIIVPYRYVTDAVTLQASPPPQRIHIIFGQLQTPAEGPRPPEAIVT